MKFLVVFAAVILAINAASDAELWSEFKKNHGRDYKSFREERYRFSVFQQNLKTINEHNEKYEKGESTYYMGVNQFADKTLAEYHQMLNYSKVAKPTLRSGKPYKMSGIEIPSEVNWLSKGIVTPVKNQGSCGSCWAFSAVGSIESQHAIKTGELIDLSEQNLVDCSGAYGNDGCDGGLMDYAFAYVRDNGIEKTSDYPYTGRDDRCAFSRSKSVLNVAGWSDIPSEDEDALADAIATVGPIAVAVNADGYEFYAGGIYDDSTCDSYYLDHGVLAVGYGEQHGVKYYLVKNSWGADWGENGYIKMVRNKSNQCGIASEASYAEL